MPNRYLVNVGKEKGRKYAYSIYDQYNAKYIVLTSQQFNSRKLALEHAKQTLDAFILNKTSI